MPDQTAQAVPPSAVTGDIDARVGRRIFRLKVAIFTLPMLFPIGFRDAGDAETLPMAHAEISLPLPVAAEPVTP